MPGCKTQFYLLNITIKNVSKEQSLAAINDISPTFKSHFKYLEEINQQPNALVRITNFTSPFQRSSFIKS